MARWCGSRLVADVLISSKCRNFAALMSQLHVNFGLVPHNNFIALWNSQSKCCSKRTASMSLGA
eukprot:237917-Amphidinium_carterae.1